MAIEKSVKDSGILGLGTALNALLGLFFYLLVIRNLQVGAYGEFTFLIAIGGLAYEILDLGINSSILKFGHGENFSKTLTLAFYERILISSIIFVVALLAQLYFQQNFLLSACLASSLLFFSIINQAFIVKEKYFFSIIYNILTNSLRLGLVAVAIYLTSLTINTALWISFMPSLTVFFIGLAVVVKKLNYKVAPQKEVLSFKKTVFSFSIWIGISQAVSSLSAKIGSPLLFALAGPIQTGLFGSAQTITGAFSQFAGVLDSVFAPKLAGGDKKNHFRILVMLAFAMSAVTLCAIPFVKYFVNFLFPPDYYAAIPVIEILLVGYAFFFLSVPFSTSTVYKHGKSGVHLTSSGVQLVAIVLLYFILVPKFGAIGAATAFVAVNFINFLIFIISHFIFSKVKS